MHRINAEIRNFIIIISLNFLVFFNYWIGRSTPPWDFLGGGQVEQFRFYLDGNFFNPPSWFPYGWFGIPEYQMLQDGGWFIPVAFVAEIFSWTPPNAARVQAFLILVGTLGTYFLSKIIVKNRNIALLAASMYCFIPAFFSNAQHYGVVRAGALLPWLLYFLTPQVTVKNKFAIVIGSIIIFQTIVGSYPGNLVSIIYTCLIYVFYNLFSENENKFLYFKNIFFMSIAGLLMGSLRYLPVLTNLNTFPDNPGNQAGVSFNNLIYLVFPYTDSNLPWADPSLRSIYISSITLILIFFLNFKNKSNYIWMILFIFSIFLMMQNVLNDHIRTFLPLANISRFAITDWRNIFNLSLIMMTILTLEEIQNSNIISKFRSIIFFVFLIYIIYLGYLYDFSYIKIVLYISPIIVIYFILFYWKSKNIIQILIIFNILLGFIFAMDNSLSWLTTVKEQYFNIYRKDYSAISQNINYPLEKRTRRYFFKSPPLTQDEYKADQKYNRFWLTGDFGALGYHNIKDIPAYKSLFPRLEKSNDPIISFLTMAGTQLISEKKLTDETKIINCWKILKCNYVNSVKVDQISFDRESEIFQVNALQNFELIQNEMYSPVWTGSVCNKNDCQTISSYPTFDSLRSWTLPRGNYVFTTRAKTPFNTQRWILFYLGILVSISGSLLNYRSATINNKTTSS